MVKRIVITSFLFCCCASTTFAEDGMAREYEIAAACKPYLQQYSSNTNPDKLPPAAQAALVACKEHSSCMMNTLSNPITGIPNCVTKLDSLQPHQHIPPVIITPATQTAKPIQKTAPKSPWYIGSPPAQPAAAPSNAEPSTPPPAAESNMPEVAPPPPTNPASTDPNQNPDNKKNTGKPTINWF